MAEFLHYFPQALTFTNLLTLVLGVIGGLILGATPGLSPTMAVALLVPFTFHMEPATGLILLGAVYTATVAGGAISAILINIPGAPANIATLLDGPPHGPAGQAPIRPLHLFLQFSHRRAVRHARHDSVHPSARKDSPQVWPVRDVLDRHLRDHRHVGAFSGTIAKGLIGGMFGLLISTIGYSPLLGVPRFVFLDVLTGGVAIVPALIGLFAIPRCLSGGKARRAYHAARLQTGAGRAAQNLRPEPEDGQGAGNRVRGGFHHRGDPGSRRTGGGAHRL